MSLFWCKAIVKCFGLDNLYQEFDIMSNAVLTVVDACRDNRCKEKEYRCIVICWFMPKYTYIYWRHTDAMIMIKTQEDFFIIIFTSHFICKGTKGYSKFACERELETEHNWNILLWPSALCLSRSPGLLNWRPLCWVLGAGFPYYTSSYSGSNSTRLCSFCSIRRPYITFKLPRGDMDTPPRLRNFFRYLAIGMCHFRYLWNGLCDRHLAEITVM